MDLKRVERDPEQVKAIIQKLIEGGHKKLQIVSDFDSTITAIGSLSSWGIVETMIHSDEFKQKARAWYEKYHPIEISADISFAEKVKAMEEWWRAAHDDLIEVGMFRKSCTEMMAACGDKVIFRDHFKEMMEHMASLTIPCLVFSAGLGDAVQEALIAKGCFPPSAHVVSNFMTFDGEGAEAKATGWNEPLIHVFSKHLVNMNDVPYFKEVADRTNIILLGDSVGDVQMAEGLKVDNILKIGFLNLNVEERLEQFKAVYDIILITDNSMQVVFDLVKQITQS